MTIIQATNPKTIDRAVRTAAECLRTNGVIAAPTDTVYGLITAWSNEAGRRRIFQLKQRSSEKHLQMLASDLAMAEAAGLMIDERITALAHSCWPGALTIIGRSREGGTLGVRVPDRSFVRELLRQTGYPLAATSANLSGRPPALTARDAVHDLAGTPNLLVDGGSITNGQASTVVSLLDQRLRVVREGMYSESDLLRVLGR
ncbi:MAG: threonylcarbamoyl-AMP synthase [Candidatus Pacebacteria bacterium]|nr:threonylcarbamoyl-AMP synthase [Candidatus Paceibacterota bacterium]